MMNKIVPHNISFNLIKIVNKVGAVLLWGSAIVSILIITIEKSSIQPKEACIHWLNCSLCILAILYYLEDIFQSYLFHKAELNLKNDFIDNSLGTIISEKNSQGYYSNDNIKQGLYKLGVNNFENSFFTKSIAKRMLHCSIIKSIVLFSLFLIVIFYADHKLLISLIQIVLPFTVIQQTIRLAIFHSHIHKIFEKYTTIFTSVVEEDKNSLILNNVVNYEKSLSWACIQLDSGIFEKLNPQLTEEWEILKTKCKII